VPRRHKHASSHAISSTKRQHKHGARQHTQHQRTTWHASSIPEPERAGNPTDDDVLNAALRNKVNELYGNRNNVTIDVEMDGEAMFNVRRGPKGADWDETKSAWMVIRSILVLSACAGIVFTALYYSGAVHGSSQSERRYEMPTYGSRSYIDPYEMLNDDRQLQDSRSEL